MPDSKTLATLSTVEDLTTEVLHKLQGLSAQEWESPSRCHMWAIKDVACHMIAVSGFYLNSINRSKDGDGMPPEGMPPQGGAGPTLPPTVMPDAAMGVPPPMPTAPVGPSVPPGTPRPGAQGTEGRLAELGLVPPTGGS